MSLRECLSGQGVVASLLLCSVVLIGMARAYGELLPLQMAPSPIPGPAATTGTASAREAIETLLLPPPLTAALPMSLAADLAALSFDVPPADVRALHQFLKQEGVRAPHRDRQASAEPPSATPLLAAGWMLLPVLGALTLRGQPAAGRQDD